MSKQSQSAPSQPVAEPSVARAGGALTVSLSAVSFAAILIVWTHSSPIFVAFGRLALAFLLLLPTLLLPKVRRDFRVALRAWPIAVVSGALLGMHLLFWIASLRETSVATSMFLLSSQAVFALVLSHLLLREFVGIRGWIAVGLGAIGAALIVGGDLKLGRGMGGAILALLSALAFVFYLAAGRIGRRTCANLPWLILVYASAAAILIPFLPSAWPEQGFDWSRELGLLLLLAIGPTILGHGLMNYSLKHVRIHVVNLTLLGEPFLAVLWAYFLLGENLSAWALPGGLLVACGCVVAIREEVLESNSPSHKKRTPPDRPEG